MLHCYAAMMLVSSGLIILLIPIIFAFSWWRIRHWPKMPSRIVSASIESRRNPVGAGVVVTEYRPSVEYEYEVNGRHYLGKRIGFRDRRLWTDRRERAEFGSLTPGADVMVGVSPTNPSKSIIDTTIRLRDIDFLVMLTVLGILIVFVGVWVATLVCIQ